MTALSTGPYSTSLITNQNMFIPFVAIMKINFPSSASYGKREERNYEIQKIANKAQTELHTLLVTNGYIDESSEPVKFTVAFGNFVAKLTINGNVNPATDRNEIPNQPTEPVTVLNTNRGVVGYGCNTASNRVADAYIEQFAKDLENLLNSIVSDAEVMSLEVAGIRFGNRGRTF